MRGVVGEDEFESREGRRAYSGDLTENSENGGNKRDGESHLCCERGKANGDGLRGKRNGREEPKIQRKAITQRDYETTNLSERQARPDGYGELEICGTRREECGEL